MPGMPPGRSILSKYWPEVTTVGVGAVLLGGFHLPVIAALALSVIGYLGFQGFNHFAQKETTGAEPSVEDLVRQLARLQINRRLAPFRADVAALTGVVVQRLLSVPEHEQDPELRELTRVTLSEALRYTQSMAALPIPPDAQSQVSQNYRSLLRTSAEELTKSYAAVYGKDDAALAAQLEKSRQVLEAVHQQIRSGEG